MLSASCRLDHSPSPSVFPLNFSLLHHTAKKNSSNDSESVCLCLVLQIQQLEEHLEKSREELSQLKSDLQENVELVSFMHYSF